MALNYYPSPYNYLDGKVRTGRQVLQCHHETFEELPFGWARDRKRVYQEWSQCNKADLATFRVLNVVYGVDCKAVHVGSSVMKQADASTFRALDPGYLMDSHEYYGRMDEISYGADNKRAFFRRLSTGGRPTGPLAKADTTKLISLRNGFAEDGTRAYVGCSLLKGADLKSWFPLYGLSSIDKSHIFYDDEARPRPTKGLNCMTLRVDSHYAKAGSRFFVGDTHVDHEQGQKDFLAKWLLSAKALDSLFLKLVEDPSFEDERFRIPDPIEIRTTGGSVSWDGRILDGINPLEFQPLDAGLFVRGLFDTPQPGGYARDGARILWLDRRGATVVPGADPETFRSLRYGYGIDKEGVWCAEERLPAASPSEWMYLGQGYSRTIADCYYLARPLQVEHPSFLRPVVAMCPNFVYSGDGSAFDRHTRHSLTRKKLSFVAEEWAFLGPGNRPLIRDEEEHKRVARYAKEVADQFDAGKLELRAPTPKNDPPPTPIAEAPVVIPPEPRRMGSSITLTFGPDELKATPVASLPMFMRLLFQGEWHLLAAELDKLPAPWRRSEIMNLLVVAPRVRFGEILRSNQDSMDCLRRLEDQLSAEDRHYLELHRTPRVYSLGDATMRFIFMPPGFYRRNAFLAGGTDPEAAEGVLLGRVARCMEGFWISEWPILQAEYKHVIGKLPKGLKHKKPFLPVHGPSWVDAMGDHPNGSPATPTPDSVLGRFGAALGLPLTLPTMQQYERAVALGSSFGTVLGYAGHLVTGWLPDGPVSADLAKNPDTVAPVTSLWSEIGLRIGVSSDYACLTMMNYEPYRPRPIPSGLRLAGPWSAHELALGPLSPEDGLPRPNESEPGWERDPDFRAVARLALVSKSGKMAFDERSKYEEGFRDSMLRPCFAHEE
ncbi:MAG: DKNYY domain-containing protein [Candidatus Sumerlaeia bacterium]|nr:DKNYY domain-containing protein [Candidatus Sumerlaeia bacterium]